MQFNSKIFQISKTKQYLRKNYFFLFSVSANQDAQNWVITEQNLHKLKLSYYKINNNTTVKALQNSMYINSISIINSTFFFLKPEQNNKLLTRYNLINILKSVFFIILAIKLNEKVYAIVQLKSIRSFNCKKNISILYQFLLVNLTFSHVFIEKKNYFLRNNGG